MKNNNAPKLTSAAAVFALTSALLLAACAQQPSAALHPTESALQNQPHWPTQQCRFITQTEDWQQVTEALKNGATENLSVVRLRAQGTAHTPDILASVLELGQVQVRSAKPTASISKIGTPNPLPQAWKASTGDAPKDQERQEANRLNGQGYFNGPIDLRFRFPAWEYAFAITNTQNADCPQRSLVFFNNEGVLINSITLANTSHNERFAQLVAQFRHPQQTAPQLTQPSTSTKATETTVADSEVDLAAYHAAWNGITDVHQFNRIMREFKLGREQAIRLGPTDKVKALQPQSVLQLFQKAAALQTPIMIFVSNGAVTQIHGGPIHQVRQSGDWLIIDDPDAYITINTSAIANAWRIERGGIYSVDLYDKEGQLITSLFGVRTKENPKPTQWIDLVKELPTK